MTDEKKPATPEKPKGNLYYYPHLGITIVAKDQEEADNKAKESESVIEKEQSNG